MSTIRTIAIVSALIFLGATAAYGFNAIGKAIQVNSCINASMGDDQFSPTEVVDNCERKHGVESNYPQVKDY